MAIDDTCKGELIKSSVTDLKPGDYFVSGGRIVEFAGTDYGTYRGHFNVFGADGKTYNMWNVDAYYRRKG